MHFRILFSLKLLVMITTISDRSFLYNTDRNPKTDFDCIYANIIESINRTYPTFLHTNYLTPYCRRLASDDVIDNIKGNVENTITFKDLRSQGMGSAQLLQWSISIDRIEQYAKYLITNDTKFDQYIFYNCSTLWFGSHCQYTFGLNISIDSFGEFVEISFNNREQYLNQLTINTCYPHLSGCYRGPGLMCLDWREICNGIVDCIGDINFGIDEQYCEELELTECKENEYRCHNGAQCIPLEFFLDEWRSKDCLDGTDEPDIVSDDLLLDKFIKLNCIKISTFPCEERSCRNTRVFPCGDGDCHNTGLNTQYIFPYTYICPGTSRDSNYLQTIYTTARNISGDCQKLVYCTLFVYFALSEEKYNEINCSDDWLLLNNCSMDYTPFPADPVLGGYFQVLYSSKNLITNFSNNMPPDYVCNNPRQCLQLPKTTLRIGGLDCRPFEQVATDPYYGGLYYLYSALSSSAYQCSSIGNKSVQASNSSLFYCPSSHKYISKHRLLDGVRDCYGNEDELYPHSCLLNDSLRYFCKSENKCISPIGVGYDSPDCQDREDHTSDTVRPSVFALLCDRIFNAVREDDETDENNCEWWPCKTPYTRCDTHVQCANGIDELNCPNLGCGTNELKCQTQHSSGYRCIPQADIFEKPLNCNDDETTCRNIFYSNHSVNSNDGYLSWKEKTCLTNNDICGYQSNDNQQLLCNLVNVRAGHYCDKLILNTDDNEPICTLTENSIDIRFGRFFSALYLGYFPPLGNQTSISSNQSTSVQQTKIISFNTSMKLIEYCNRGILIYEGKTYKKRCLCPPSYFGDQCEWQNQRISLTFQINKISSIGKKNFIYDIFVYLIDQHDQIISSYEKINFIPSINCQMKYNRYLLYPTKPKDLHRNYSIHIDIFDKAKLDYYASWYSPISFPFLPVHRLSNQIVIPSDKPQSSNNCSLECGTHGKCYDYINAPQSFCHCDSGYSGRFCNLTSNCSCSSGSVCLNSSICLCPLNKHGSECYLEHVSCYPKNPCQNNGQCVPIDDRINKYAYMCFCTEDFMGLNCEYKSNRIDIHFKTEMIPSVIFAHFVTAFDDKYHERTTIFKKIPFDQQSLTLFTSRLFHILLIEYFNHSYLTVLRENFISSEHISVDITNENMCMNITKLFNSTILQINNTLRRYKYYQLPCLENLKLKCFYDTIHMCICDQNRFSNCFEFDHNMTYDCRDNNQCENNGKCFQDNATCPQESICMCEKCYYGSKCQLTTEGFSLSLDVIFGYHIKPFVSFFQQSLAVKITTSVTTVMFIFGFLSGLLSLLTFRRKTLIEVGCGIYLFINSINSIITICIFTIKYIELLLFQMNIITNRSFLHYNCLLIDILLKIVLSSGDWLNACVAIERAITTIQGVQFNKSKSKLLAKRITPIMFFLIILSYIHDPISRQLFDDEDEQRIWCIVNYSSGLQIYNRFINFFHFLIPFILNILSALIIIFKVFKLHVRIQKPSSNENVLYVEMKRHKYLLISPCVLILLAVPRLLISVSSQCMESIRDPWLVLCGYYISFVPPLLILIIFILPSETYRKELTIVIRKSRLLSAVLNI